MTLLTLLIGIVTLISTSFALLSTGSGVLIAIACGIVAGSLLSSVFAAVAMLLTWRKLSQDDGVGVSDAPTSFQR